MASVRRPANQEVLAKVEKVFEDIADNLIREESISIPLRYKKPASTLPEAEVSSVLTHVSFPGATPQEARQFSELLSMLPHSNSSDIDANVSRGLTDPRTHPRSTLQQ